MLVLLLLMNGFLGWYEDYKAGNAVEALKKSIKGAWQRAVVTPPNCRASVAVSTQPSSPLASPCLPARWSIPLVRSSAALLLRLACRLLRPAPACFPLRLTQPCTSSPPRRRCEGVRQTRRQAHGGPSPHTHTHTTHTHTAHTLTPPFHRQPTPPMLHNTHTQPWLHRPESGRARTSCSPRVFCIAGRPGGAGPRRSRRAPAGWRSPG